MIVEQVTDAGVAGAILGHPLRPRILAAAQQPISAADLARRLGQTRQRVNYHVRQLAEAGLLREAGRAPRGNMIEQRYQASAATYVLAPELLGEAAPAAVVAEESNSAAQLLALCARAQSEVASVVMAAEAAGVRVRTQSWEREIHFENGAQRTAFMAELSAAISEVISRHSSGTGRPFRLVLGCYPVLQRTE